MKHHVALLPAALLFGITLLGCDAPTPTASGPPAPPPPPGSAPPPPPAAPEPSTAPAPLPPETKFGVFAGDVNDLAARPASPQPAPQPAGAPTTPPTDPNVERVKAQAGVGAKGRSLDQYEGLVVTPVKAFFAGKERAFFDIEFPGNYRVWRVQEDRAPKDFDELKAKFLDPLGLTKHLPPLPPGHKYVWDATSEELQVERPKR